MGTSRLKLMVLGAVATLAGGCGEDMLDEDKDIRTWVNSGSAVAVYTHAYELIAFADGRTGVFEDPACPVTADDGTTVTITGGCTDTRGVEFVGSATIVRGAGGSRTLMLDEYARVGDPDFRVPVTGEVVVTPMGATTHAFTAELVAAGGATVTISYEGTVEGTYDGRTVWNGSGTVERDSVLAPSGTARVSTENEVLDSSVCMGQPVSGTTTVRTDGHTAVLTYDGATDCDSDHTATWTLDGENQGKVTGITCNVSPFETAAAAWPIAFALFALATRRRPVR